MTFPRRIVSLECKFRYEAAHWLPDVPEGHQCGRMHGHSYELTVMVKGPVRPDGFVVDFADVKKMVEPIIKEKFDHYTLNYIDGLENPTVENQLIWLWDRLSALPHLFELRLQETANNSAAYRGEHVE